MSKGNEGRCYGKWDIKDPACSKCLAYVRVKCEETTKRLSAPAASDDVGTTENGGSVKEELIVNEYFLRLLEGKIPRRVQWGDPFVENFFERDGKIVVFVAYNNVTGEMKVRTPTMRRFVKLESVEQAEALAKEVFG